MECLSVWVPLNFPASASYQAVREAICLISVMLALIVWLRWCLPGFCTVKVLFFLCNLWNISEKTRSVHFKCMYILAQQFHLQKFMHSCPWSISSPAKWGWWCPWNWWEHSVGPVLEALRRCLTGRQLPAGSPSRPKPLGPEVFGIQNLFRIQKIIKCVYYILCDSPGRICSRRICSSAP